ncbi:Gfo/Idh/MocA family protein [Bacillus sp. N9]
MVEVCQRHNVVFMEAFMYQFHPQHDRVREIIQSGAIGEVKLIQSAFTFPLDPAADNIRLNKEVGGGSLFDVGCYCVHASRMITGEEPSLIEGTASIHPELQIDLNCVGLLKFPSGVIASFNSSFEQQKEMHMRFTERKDRSSSHLLSVQMSRKKAA